MCIVLCICVMGMFPTGVRSCLVQTGVQCLEVESFDSLRLSRKRYSVGCNRSQSCLGSRSDPRHLWESTGRNQVCGAMGALLCLLTCAEDVNCSLQ